MSKIRNVERNYLKDMAKLANNYLDIRRCPGGRPVHAMYRCMHCGVDPDEGVCKGVQGFAKSK